MRRLGLVASLLALGFVARSAAAQSTLDLNSLGTQDDFDWNDVAAQPKIRATQFGFGQCVVKKRPDIAARYVLEQSDKRAKGLVPWLTDGDCLIEATPSDSSPAVRMQFPGDFMKYALADALVRREFKAGPITNLKAVPRLGHDEIDPQDYVPKAGKTPTQKELDDLAKAKLRDEATVYLAKYGECVVRADPADSYGLLMAVPGTAEESTAFGRLNGALSECVPTGQTIQLNKATVRGTVAYNYYRLAKAAQNILASAAK